MTREQDSSWHTFWGKESILTAVSLGGFLILVGMIFALKPDLPGQIETFFRNLTTSPFPSGSTSGFRLPVPINPTAHSGLYTALFQFDIGFGILQAVILAIRLALRSRIHKIAETVEHLTFWFGAAALTNIFLLTGVVTVSSWFQYWAFLLILIGVGVLIRALILLATRSKAKPKGTMVS